MHRLYKKLLLVPIAMVTCLPAFSQIKVGEWRDHLPYKNAKVIACSDEEVYCATEMALFSYNKADGYIQKLSKINILSDLEPGYIAYSKDHEKLIIGYLNGNIDVIENGIKYNFPDIKIKDIIADKNINHINIENNLAYIATGFGIIVFNLEKNEFADSYIIGEGGSYENVNNTAVYDGYLYALTNNGVLRGAINDPFLGNYQNWEKVDSLLNPEGRYTSSTTFNNSLILVNKLANTDTCHLISFKNNTWDTLRTDLRRVGHISNNNNQLVIPHLANTEVFDQNMQSIMQTGFGYCNHALIDGDNLWLASPYSTLVHFFDGAYTKRIKPNGPESKNAFKVFNNNGVIKVAPGGYGNSFLAADVYSIGETDNWDYLSNNTANKEHLKGFRNVVDFAALNKSSHYVAATYGYGIIEVDEGEIVNTYNNLNTDSIIGKYIGGIAYDRNGNLHMISNYITHNFVVKTNDNKWYNYNYNGLWYNDINASSRKLISTYNGDLWTISKEGQGIFVYNINGTPETDSDDNYKRFSFKDESNNVLSPNLNDIVQDIEGAIWIATRNGVGVYDYPENALREGYEFYARRPQIVVDGYLHDLLEGEYVTCIAVDGANRKWLGTEGGGLFLVSADGTEQIISWNTDNSPLFSNNIYSVDINQKTGELFIGTDKGIQSYKSTSSEYRADYSDIYAFPNPVKGDYNGLITIRGLMYQSDVKITDLSGNKVYETISNGGDAIWNGKDLSGNAVAPGIYLVMCTLEDGSEAEATKILIVK